MAVFTTLAETQEGDAHLRDIRRRLHSQPELGFRETATSQLVAQLLAQWGWQVTTGIGGTGVVGSLTVTRGAPTEGRPGRLPSIGLRADMDALPLSEESGLPYASRHAGVMHACGHDGHTTMLLGAARHLAATRRFHGTVHLIFQPAEEVGQRSGAQAMIADGLFDRFPCDAVFGAHNHPGLDTGTFLLRPGPFMAASDQVVIRIHGTGGHAARPHLTVDPVVVGASLVMALQTIASRNIDPLQPAVVTVGMFHAGTAHNVVSNQAVLELSVRSFDAQVRDQMKRRITELTHAQVQSYGATATIDYREGYPVVVNDARCTAFAADVARELVGADRVIAPGAQQMGGEDFAYMLQQRPGCFLRIGNGLRSYGLHDPRYDFDDRNLSIGAAYWARLAERFLATPAALSPRATSANGTVPPPLP